MFVIGANTFVVSVEPTFSNKNDKRESRAHLPAGHFWLSLLFGGNHQR
jgi:hypothetical protein